ncbi:MAG: putative N-octanoylanthranilate hydrolase AqdA1 [Chlamydiales bacterium]|nr:putative N-octanoylanthranilate hydrolase AqdA1 [Chlamydiales bacterium]MCH9619086.1 putative N-octanoylanthranilate hydrolase AqdA1 [Chlamydiales bacterium]MCH9622348.1 putative N-octanoylanthranilate hydrolase AqdA1 [Chlamydiales bacterium]
MIQDSYNVFKTIPDPWGWLQANREKAQAVQNQLAPIKDISYGQESIQKLDIYAPLDGINVPVLIDVHGGGWTHGSKMPRALQAKAILSKGIIWIPIDYGLAPDYSIDQMIDHVRCAMSWVYQNIKTYGGNPDQLFVFGNSSGAHLAATALMPGWPARYKLPDDVIKGACFTSGIYDLKDHVRYNIPPQELLCMTQEEAKSVSPLSNLPTEPLPVVMAYGENELENFIVQSQKYANALQERNCPVTLIEVPMAHHFDMINALSDSQGKLFKALTQMING